MAEKRPFRAYSGNGNYIFVSYSHSDSKKVYEVINGLFCGGCNIWYDQGIPNNSVLDKQIAGAISKCSLFIIFLSPSSLASKYVMGKELPLARKLQKPIFYARLYDDDRSDCVPFGISDPPVSCDKLAAMIPDLCRDCKSREPEPIFVDMTNGMDFNKDQLVAAEYHFESSELVLTKYHNLGAINDDKDDIGELRIPDHIAGHPVRRIIGNGVFSELEGETETLILPDALAVIGEGVFEDAEFDRIVLPPTIKSIARNCFAGSTISEMYIPFGIETICESAFEGCEGIDEIYIPASVKKIEDMAFANCTSLECIIIPPQTTVLEGDIFGDDTDVCIYCVKGSSVHKYAERHGLRCSFMTAEEMDDIRRKDEEQSRAQMERFAERERLALNEKQAAMAKTACILTDEADAKAIMPLLDNLRLDGISTNVVYEPDNTLSSYAAVVMILSETSCKKRVIPAYTPKIERPVYPIMLNGKAFVPDEFAGRFVVHQNDRTFDELYGDVRDWLVGNGCRINEALRISAMNSPFDFWFEDSGEVSLHRYRGKEKRVTVPESWLGLSVTSIASYAFYNSGGHIELIVIGKTVKRIECYAFENCTALKSVVIPPNVTELENDIFSGCGNVVICGASGSQAHKYALDNGMDFIMI